MILLVEDNPDDVFLTVHAFEVAHIRNEIVVASDGVEALELLLPEDGREPLCPAIVLLDIHMPRLGGMEVLSVLRADPRTQSLPVIVLTSSQGGQDVAESYHLGANSFVRKPVSSEDFLHVAHLLGVYWLDVNRQAAQNAAEHGGRPHARRSDAGNG